MNANYSEDRNIDNPERMILMIYNDPRKISYSLYDPKRSVFSLFKELSPKNQSDSLSAFKEAFSDSDFFSLPFRKIWIMNRTPAFTFIPKSIYKDKYKEDFIRFLFSDHRGITMDHSISSAGITVLYQMPNEAYEFMTRSFDEPSLIHYSAPMITYFFMQSKKINNRQMVVNLQDNGVDIFCFSKKTFLFGNYFSCNNLHDAFYYIIFTWKQLQLNQLDDLLLVAGNAVYKEELIERLTPYLQQIQQLTISPDICSDGIDINQIPFELAALSLCEL